MKKKIINPARIVAFFLGVVCIVGPFSGCDDDGSTTSPPTPTGYALAIGLNKVDPGHYCGWNGELSGCEPDAMDMKEIAENQGLIVETLLTAQATRERVLAELDDLAGRLMSGDLLVVSYSGHGGYLPDLNGDESDGLDETWCLYDGEILDDELHGAWMKFQAGVRILVFSDSCHSGTVLRMKKLDMENPPLTRVIELEEKWTQMRVPPMLDRAKIRALPEMREAVRVRPQLRERIGRSLPSRGEPNEVTTFKPPKVEEEHVIVTRSIPPSISIQTYEKNRSFYDKKGLAAPREDIGVVKACVILISGCEDAQTSADIGFNGLFTWKLKSVWNNGAFIGDHHRFHEEIRDRVLAENAGQSPCFYQIGRLDDTFIGQRPYTVAE
jgi:hypothetical protein